MGNLDTTVKKQPIPSLMDIPDAPLRKILQAVKETLEVGEGTKGGVTDRYVTVADLVSQDFVNGLAGYKYSIAKPNIDGRVGDLIAPQAPSDFVVTPGVYTNVLTWTNPRDSDLWYIEIWLAKVVAGAAAPDSADAELIGIVTAPGTIYNHTGIMTTYDYYYFIRAVDYAGNKSAFAGDDVPGSESYAVIVQQILFDLEGNITESQLATDLATKINEGEAAYTYFENFGNGFTIKTQADGYVVGVGQIIYLDWDAAETYSVGDYVWQPDNDTVYSCKLESTNNEPPNATYWDVSTWGAKSEFIIRTDKFAIINPTESGGTEVPFIVGNVGSVPTVGINGNLVVDGTIIADAIATDAITAVHIAANAVVIDSLDAGLTARVWDSSTKDFSEIGGATKPEDNATDNTVYRQDAAPAGASDGDIWYDTNNYAVYLYASGWQVAGDRTAYMSQDLDWITDLGTLDLSSGSIDVSGTYALTIKGGGSVLIEEGGDLVLKNATAVLDAGKLIFEGDAYDAEMFMDDDDNFWFNPLTTDQCEFYFGDNANTKHWQNILGTSRGVTAALSTIAWTARNNSSVHTYGSMVSSASNAGAKADLKANFSTTHAAWISLEAVSTDSTIIFKTGAQNVMLEIEEDLIRVDHDALIEWGFQWESETKTLAIHDNSNWTTILYDADGSGLYHFETRSGQMKLVYINFVTDTITYLAGTASGAEPILAFDSGDVRALNTSNDDDLNWHKISAFH